jgi:hypothetical protein
MPQLLQFFVGHLEMADYAPTANRPPVQVRDDALLFKRPQLTAKAARAWISTAFPSAPQCA